MTATLNAEPYWAPREYKRRAEVAVAGLFRNENSVPATRLLRTFRNERQGPKMIPDRSVKRRWCCFSLRGLLACIACFAAGVACERYYDHWTDAKSANGLQQSISRKRANINEVKELLKSVFDENFKIANKQQ